MSFSVVQLWIEVGKHWERKAEYNVLILFLATCTWIPSLTHSAVHYNASVLPKVLVLSPLLQLCLLVPSTDLENGSSPRQPVPLLILGPTCKLMVSAFISFHSPHSTPKRCSVQAPLLGCRMPSGSLLQGKLAVPPASPPATSPGSFRQARGLNPSLTGSCPFCRSLRTQSWPFSPFPACSIDIFKLSLFRGLQL